MGLSLIEGLSFCIFKGFARFFSGIKAAFRGSFRPGLFSRINHLQRSPRRALSPPVLAIKFAFGAKRKLIGRKNWLTRSRMTQS